jgi:hypothetical protein
MLIPIMFGLIGLMTGGLTLLALRYSLGTLYLAGVLFLLALLLELGLPGKKRPGESPPGKRSCLWLCLLFHFHR